MQKKHIITGEKGSGKTTYLKKYTETLKNNGLKVGGFISEAIIQSNLRNSYEIVDLFTGAKELLCSINNIDSKIRIGNFGFFDKGIELGLNSLNNYNIGNKNIIVIDEIGPLEIGGGGWAPALDRIFNNYLNEIFISIRFSLLNEVIEKWQLTNYSIFNLNDSKNYPVN